MSERTLTLSGFALNSLHHGHEIVVVDSEGRCVAVTPPEATQENSVGLRVQLRPADLDLIESPEGLVCASADGAMGWLVRVAA